MLLLLLLLLLMLISNSRQLAARAVNTAEADAAAAAGTGIHISVSKCFGSDSTKSRLIFNQKHDVGQCTYIPRHRHGILGIHKYTRIQIPLATICKDPMFASKFSESSLRELTVTPVGCRTPLRSFRSMVIKFIVVVPADLPGARLSSIAFGPGFISING